MRDDIQAMRDKVVELEIKVDRVGQGKMGGLAWLGWYPVTLFSMAAPAIQQRVPDQLQSDSAGCWADS